MQDIKELILVELEGLLEKWSQPVFHAQQIFSWIYQKGIVDFDMMSNLSLALRKLLKENFFIFSSKLIKAVQSHDGTQKFLFQLKDGNNVEAVTIPTKKRVTGCISTQIGCKFACRFCASGLSGFKRNLTSAEMLDEVLWLKNNSQAKKLTHLVFMGTGEPLDNYENVLKAIRIINSTEGLAIGARRITISTCGIIPGIKRLAEENLQIELSISLHAGDDKIRSQIMPINKIYPIKDLIRACRGYINKTNRQITFEYVLIKGINSYLQNAQKLGKMMKELKLCKVNLIPVNPVRNTEALTELNEISNGVNVIRGLKIEPPERSEILLFQGYLLKQGLNVTLRKPRGQDIEAACGQLRLKYA